MTRLDRFIGTTVDKKAFSFAWFGFSADPPTRAHRNIVKAVLKFVDNVIVFPSGNVPYKEFVANKKDRLAMTKLWKKSAKFGSRAVISSFDLARKNAFHWIDLWKKIKSIAPEKKHYLVVGSDQYLAIEKTWEQGKQLLQSANFLVAPRKGFPVGAIPSHHQLLSMKPVSSSSSSFRQGKRAYVDSLVKSYIMKKKLYS